MSEPQVTMSGPAQLRFMAEASRANGYTRLGSDLDQLAALWEQDLARAANDLMLSEESFVQMRAKRDDVLRELQAKSAALEIAQAKADLIGGEVCAHARAEGRGPCGACAWCVKQATERAERAEAAMAAVKLERNGWYEYSESLSLEVHRLKNELAFQEPALERARALAERMPHDGWCATVLDGGNVACDCIKGQLAAALGEGGAK